MDVNNPVSDGKLEEDILYLIFLVVIENIFNIINLKMNNAKSLTHSIASDKGNLLL